MAVVASGCAVYFVFSTFLLSQDSTVLVLVHFFIIRLLYSTRTSTRTVELCEDFYWAVRQSSAALKSET